MEAERLPLARRQRLPMGAHGFEQREGALDVGADEGAGAVDAAVDMALGGEVHHRARPVLGQQPVEQRPVADVAAHEHMPRIAVQRRQVAEVAGVGQRVEVEHRLVALREPVEHEVGTDETGAASDEDHEQEGRAAA